MLSHGIFGWFRRQRLDQMDDAALDAATDASRESRAQVLKELGAYLLMTFLFSSLILAFGFSPQSESPTENALLRSECWSVLGISAAIVVALTVLFAGASLQVRPGGCRNNPEGRRNAIWDYAAVGASRIRSTIAECVLVASVGLAVFAAVEGALASQSPVDILLFMLVLFSIVALGGLVVTQQQNAIARRLEELVDARIALLVYRKNVKRMEAELGQTRRAGHHNRSVYLTYTLGVLIAIGQAALVAGQFWTRQGFGLASIIGFALSAVFFECAAVYEYVDSRSYSRESGERASALIVVNLFAVLALLAAMGGLDSSRNSWLCARIATLVGLVILVVAGSVLSVRGRMGGVLGYCSLGRARKRAEQAAARGIEIGARLRASLDVGKSGSHRTNPFRGSANER